MPRPTLRPIVSTALIATILLAATGPASAAPVTDAFRGIGIQVTEPHSLTQPVYYRPRHHRRMRHRDSYRR